MSGRTVFFSACAFVLRFYMGSVREQLLQGVHSNATAAAAEGGTSGVTVADVDQQVEIFNVVVGVGFSSIPLYSCAVEKGGHPAAFAASSLALVGAMGLGAARPSLPLGAQVGTFAFLSVSRQFLFSSFFAVVLQLFGTKAYGRLIGGAGLVAGSIQLGTAHSSKERRRPLFWRPFWTVTQPAPGLLAPLSGFLASRRRKQRKSGEKTSKNERDMA